MGTHNDENIRRKADSRGVEIETILARGTETKTQIMKKKILFIVSSAKQIGPKRRPTGNFITETAHPYVTFTRQGY
jgi:hypothetical protein